MFLLNSLTCALLIVLSLVSMVIKLVLIEYLKRKGEGR